MGGIWILPILQSHDEDVVPRADGDDAEEAATQDAFDHEAVAKPEPYFPERDDADK